VTVKGWEVVFRGERLHADLLAAALEARGIRVEVFGDHAYSYAINFTDARVLVPEDQAKAALKLIQKAEARRTEPPKPRAPRKPRKPRTEAEAPAKEMPPPPPPPPQAATALGSPETPQV
jgi:hypothetical protein